MMTKYNTNSGTRQSMLDLIINGNCSFELISLCAQVISIDALINAGFVKRKSDPYARNGLREILHDLEDVLLAAESDSSAYLNAIPADSEDLQAARAALAEKLAGHLGKLTEIYKRL